MGNENKLLVGIYPKYIQRYNIKNFYSIDICNWIIYETNEIIKDRKESIICITQIPYIVNYITNSFRTIISELCRFYNLNYNIFKFIFKDVIIKKYDANTPEIENKMYQDDDDCFTIKILLNDYKKTNIIFEDTSYPYMEKGSALIYPGSVKFIEPKIECGEKIYLIAKLDIFHIDSRSFWWEQCIDSRTDKSVSDKGNNL